MNKITSSFIEKVLGINYRVTIVRMIAIIVQASIRIALAFELIKTKNGSA